MTADQATAIVTRTWTGTVRLRNAREHRALEHLWWWANTVRNALPDYVRSSSRSRRTHGIGASWERGHLARADARGPLGAGWKPALPGSRALENPALPGSPRSLDELGT